MPVKQSQLQNLLAKAAMDKKLRDALLANPKEAAKGENIALDDNDVRRFEGLFSALKRFSEGSKLHADDAQNWSVGLLSNTRRCPLLREDCDLYDSNSAVLKLKK